MKNKATVVRTYFDELWNRGRVELIEELLAENYVNHSPGSPDWPRGRAYVRDIVEGMRRGFPDLTYAIEDLVESEDTVVARLTVTGRHSGDFFGLAPTGRRIRVSQINVERFANGRIVAHHRVTDELAMMRQLGVVAG